MSFSDLVNNTANFVVVTFALVGILSAMVCIEYVRYLLRKRSWMSEHAAVVGTRSTVVVNEDGASVLENGVRVPATKVAGEWRYRHQVGEVVEVVGYPSFQNLFAEAPITTSTIPHA